MVILSFDFVSAIAQLSINKNDFEIILSVNEGDKYNFGEIDVNNELDKINSDSIYNPNYLLKRVIYIMQVKSKTRSNK